MKYKQDIEDLKLKEQQNPQGLKMTQEEYEEIKNKWHVVKGNIHPDTGKPIMWA